MKKISFIFLLLASLNLIAQNNNWQGDETDADYQRMINSAFFRSYNNLNHQSMTVDELKNVSFQSAAPMTFKVFIHDFDNRLNECDYLHGIRYLNEQFNQFHIYFKYIGYDTDGYDNTTNLPIPNVFNVYLTPGSGGLAGGYENIRIGQICFDESMQPPAIHASTIAHEFGHTLSCLRHTFYGTVGSTLENLTTPITSPCDGSTINRAYFPHFSSDSENVTRDPNDPNYNADIKGDRIADTPAMMHASNHCTDYVNYEIKFIYIPEVVDAVGEPYVDPFNIDQRNFMSYSPPIFRDQFTIGQGVQMRKLFNNPSTQPYLYDIKELYKPYDHRIGNTPYDNTTPVISAVEVPDKPGYVDVKRPTNEYCVFQPGYTYRIYSINSGNYTTGDIVNPSDAILRDVYYSVYSDCPVHVSGIVFGVQIPEISGDIIMYDYRDTNSSASPYQVTREAVITTDIHTTNTPGDPNGVDTTLNQQQSADPNLINNLENHKYHTIKKTTETGVQVQKTIYKQ